MFLTESTGALERPRRLRRKRAACRDGAGRWDHTASNAAAIRRPGDPRRVATGRLARDLECKHAFDALGTSARRQTGQTSPARVEGMGSPVPLRADGITPHRDTRGGLGDASPCGLFLRVKSMPRAPGACA